MIEDIQLAAVIAEGADRVMYRLPLARDVQTRVGAQWEAQYTDFFQAVHEVEFHAGFNPEDDQRFKVENFVAPNWLTAQTRATIVNLEPLDRHVAKLDRVRGIVGYARRNGVELVLFQNFTRSHILRPGFTLLLQAGTYQTLDQTGVSLSDQLAGVYFVADQKLVFRTFRGMNVILPLADVYRPAGEAEIRQILAHTALAPENVDALAIDPSQWFQKRFAMLKDSRILTDYTPKQLQNRGKKYDVEVKVRRGKLVFPADKTEAKRLLQFLNEEIFRGAITETLFVTNSKHPGM